MQRKASQDQKGKRATTFLRLDLSRHALCARTRAPHATLPLIIGESEKHQQLCPSPTNIRQDTANNTRQRWATPDISRHV